VRGLGGGLGSVSKTKQLSPGMKPSEVRSILGDPSQTQFISNKWVWKYSLHEPWKGFIPYYLVFSRDSQVLEQWFADEAKYMRQQQLWLQAIQPTQKHKVDVRIE
jgi:outer membrane protein assembly factor BamE (lipoprotein component of BamABCDE complex)